MEGLWHGVRAALRHAETARPTAEQCGGVEQFVASFIHHHEAEDRALGHAAEIVLTPHDLAEIGEAMAARRGTTWAALSARGMRA
jgi:hypothetical protein